VAYPAYIREKARELRVDKGLTIDDLAERLAIPRTTAYYWVRDLPIGKTANQTRAAFRAGQVTRKIHRDRRNAAYAQGQREYPELLFEPTFRDFVCMYIGEEICAFWGAILNVEPTAIRFQRKSNSGGLAGRSWRSRHGVLTVRTADTYFRARLQAWMDGIRAEWP
jgi:transcriptional regulator with XRE-family HTH domain